MFGRFRVVPGARFEEIAELAALGPDPLNDGIDGTALARRLARLRTPIKVALLDQTLLAGVGNIQASEALFRARIDPRRPARSLSSAEVGRLAAGIRASIAFTLKSFAAEGADGGDADIGYVEEGSANPFLVYGREGARCPGCRRSTIVRIAQAGRATFFCPRCQNGSGAGSGARRKPGAHRLKSTP
jgi:formamidopyrimidine-DNA glycosylase